MPMYLYSCPTCARKREIVKPLADLDRAENCTNCGFAMNRLICAPMVRGDYAGYNCPVTGQWIEGRRAHEENLKRHGCRVLEPGETDEFKRRRAAEDTAFENSISETVEQFVETLPTNRKEQLAAEIQSGVDVAIERK